VREVARPSHRQRLVEDVYKQLIGRRRKQTGAYGKVSRDERMVGLWVVLTSNRGDIAWSSPLLTSLAQATIRQKRVDSAHKRHVGTIKLLTLLRTLMPAGLQPAMPLRVFEPERQVG